MSFRNLGGAAIFVAALAAAACGGSSTPTPTTPSAQTYTDVFTGTLTQGGTSYGNDTVNHFTVHAAGNITATVTKLSPLSTITVGLALGTFDAATQTCTLQYGYQVQLNLALTASSSSALEACVGVVDVGNVGTDPVDYEVTIVHT